MPVFRSGVGNAPGWCELEYFEIVDVLAGASHTFERIGSREKLIVVRGDCRIFAAGTVSEAGEGANLDLGRGGGTFEVQEALTDATLVRVCGRWGDDTGGSGIFSGEESDDPHDSGDPVDGPKNTNFDNHFHDCK